LTSIGIRVTPSTVFYSIAKVENSDNFAILDTSYIVVPKALDIPSQLAFIRTTLSTIFIEYEIQRAGIRLTEHTAQTPSIFRMNIEGVIQELFANSTIEKYFCGEIATIASLIKTERSLIKEYFEGKKVFGNINDWTKYKQEEREAIITAVSALSK